MSAKCATISACVAGWMTGGSAITPAAPTDAAVHAHLVHAARTLRSSALLRDVLLAILAREDLSRSTLALLRDAADSLGGAAPRAEVQQRLLELLLELLLDPAER